MKRYTLSFTNCTSTLWETRRFLPRSIPVSWKTNSWLVQRAFPERCFWILLSAKTLFSFYLNSLETPSLRKASSTEQTRSWYKTIVHISSILVLQERRTTYTWRLTVFTIRYSPVFNSLKIWLNNSSKAQLLLYSKTVLTMMIYYLHRTVIACRLMLWCM